MNSATDNPLVFPEGGHVPEDALATGHGLVISGGNFHGEPVALALDLAKLAIAELGAISERRVALLLDPRLNDGLPAFLGASSGLDSGLMILQYTAAALASESKVLAHPASADSIPTSANQEDHVSMGSIAALHLAPRPGAHRAHPGHRAHLRRPGPRPARRPAARDPAGSRRRGGTRPRPCRHPAARARPRARPGPRGRRAARRAGLARGPGRSARAAGHVLAAPRRPVSGSSARERLVGVDATMSPPGRQRSAIVGHGRLLPMTGPRVGGTDVIEGPWVAVLADGRVAEVRAGGLRPGDPDEVDRRGRGARDAGPRRPAHAPRLRRGPQR